MARLLVPLGSIFAVLDGEAVSIHALTVIPSATRIRAPVGANSKAALANLCTVLRVMVRVRLRIVLAALYWAPHWQAVTL
jgi:hypothetical protein